MPGDLETDGLGGVTTLEFSESDGLVGLCGMVVGSDGGGGGTVVVRDPCCWLFG